MKLKLVAAVMFLSAASVSQGALILSYEFDQQSGRTAVDTSGNGYHGAITGGETYVTGVGGQGTALSLDGIDDFVTLDPRTFTETGMNDSGVVSISTWVYGGPDNPEQSTFFYGTSSPVGVSGRQMQIHLPWDNSSAYWRAPGTQIGSNIADYQADSWNHWVFTKNAETGLIQMFVNKDLIASQTTATNLFTVNGSWLGNDPSNNPNRVYNGIVDKFRVFDHELSTSEIQQLYTEGGIPEPTSIALIGLGIAATGFVRRIRK